MAQTPERQAELERLKKELRDAEINELKQQLAEAEKNETSQPEQGIIGKGLGALGKAFDYVGGNVRAAGAGAAQQFTDQDLITLDEYLKAAKGQAPFPTISEYLSRAGAGDLGRASEVFAPMIPPDSPLDVSGREAIGFAGDILTDPATYTASPLARPVGAGLEALGKMSYRSGMKRLNQAAKRAGKGKNAVSDLLWNEGVWGSSRSVADQSVDLGKRLESQANDIVNRATSSGAKIDMNRAMSPAGQTLTEYHASLDPNKIDVANTMERRIQRYLDLQGHPEMLQTEKVRSALVDASGRPIEREVTTVIPAREAPTPKQGAGMKSSLYNLVGGTKYGETGKTDLGRGVLKDLARGLKDEVERAVGTVSPKEAEKLADINSRWGTLLSTAKAMENEALKAENKHYITQVDPMIAALGFTTGGVGGGLGALAAKNAAKAAQTSAVRTGFGIGAKNLNRSKFAYPILNHELINSLLGNERKNSSWENLQR